MRGASRIIHQPSNLNPSTTISKNSYFRSNSNNNARKYAERRRDETHLSNSILDELNQNQYTTMDEVHQNNNNFSRVKDISTNSQKRSGKVTFQSTISPGLKPINPDKKLYLMKSLPMNLDTMPTILERDPITNLLDSNRQSRFDVSSNSVNISSREFKLQVDDPRVIKPFNNTGSTSHNVALEKPPSSARNTTYRINVKDAKTTEFELDPSRQMSNTDERSELRSEEKRTCAGKTSASCAIF